LRCASIAFLALCACASKRPRSAEPIRPAAAPSFDLTRAAQHLDRRALAWVNETPDAGENFKCALSCHTTHPFLAVRALLPMPSGALDEVRKRIEARVLENEDWSAATPFYGKPGSKLERLSRGTEAVMAAVTLALSDVAGGRDTGPVTSRAFDHMWSMQDADGAFPWLAFELEPWESSSDFGAAIALVACGSAPARAKQDRARVEKLAEYVRARLANEARPIGVHDQAVLLWATRRLPDLLDPIARAKIAGRLRVLQRPDGGWSLATWVRGKRPNLSIESDGYASALAAIALAESEGATANGVRRGLEWLASHQNPDGSWPARSVNADAAENDLFMSDAATGYAAYALARFAVDSGL
jgi:prenyltransferase/squalene oxidase-like repeat protein